MSVSAAGLALICAFEGFRAIPYLCPARVATIGYGSTRYADGTPVTLADPALTPEQAQALLQQTLAEYEDAVVALVRVPLTQGQSDALVDFAYNCGVSAFARSTLLRKLNAGDYLGASRQFERWNRGGGRVLAGLVRRREAERLMFIGAPDPSDESA